jgi:hypothetical protein
MLLNGNKHRKKLKLMWTPSPAQIMTDQKETENVECFNYQGNLIRNDARHTHKMKSKLALTKPAFNKNKIFFLPRNLT